MIGATVGRYFVGTVKRWGDMRGDGLSRSGGRTVGRCDEMRLGVLTDDQAVGAIVGRLEDETIGLIDFRRWYVVIFVITIITDINIIINIT